ncbi:MAG: LCP family protein [Acetivibrionales bacterium]|jgi:LCP family protein required for cell wall assembly
MNLRKFCFILTLIITVVLFCSGIGIVYYVNTNLTSFESAFASFDSPLNEILQPFVKSNEPFNVLLLGGDKVNKNSDTMMLANFNPETMNINIMSIPRDTKVTIGKTERKINYAFPHGGIDLAIKTVSEFLDVNIKYYVFVDTAAFRNIIDLLGGVEYYIPVDMDYDDPTQNLHIHLKKGHQVLNGAKAEQYVRFRKPNKWNKEIRKYYDGSDLKRIEAQQAFIRELIRQKLNLKYFPKLTSIINEVFDNIETNFSLNEIIKLSGYINKFSIDKVNFIQMPGTTYDVSPYYFICDVKKTRQIIADNFSSSLSATESISDSNKGKDGKTSTSGTKKISKSNTGTQKGAGKNGAAPKTNPSNAETSITGSGDDP